MGTAISLDIADELPGGKTRQLAAEVFDWLREVDARFSTYREDSELNQLERGELHSYDCSPDMRAVLSACAEMWHVTNGYFDVYATGRLDPSGYVKGWSAQVASDRLAAAGAVNHCLNAGGDVVVRGFAAPGEPWRVGILHPWENQKIAWVLAVSDLAVATSGVYERGFHVIDPHSQEPAEALRSVTVTGPDLAIADAYATAALAMGRPGLDWLATLGDGYESAVVDAEANAYRSDGLPVAPD
jgi:thiamine biosynthesis lipoprotein